MEDVVRRSVSSLRLILSSASLLFSPSDKDGYPSGSPSSGAHRSSLSPSLYLSPLCPVPSPSFKQTAKEADVHFRHGMGKHSHLNVFVFLQLCFKDFPRRHRFKIICLYVSSVKEQILIYNAFFPLSINVFSSDAMT